MTSIKQIEANRRNALRSTGPSSDQGKRRSRCNAVRHGLTAETVISQLEDSDDYQGFEASITADYAIETAVERELVLRLASLLWRLRRASAIETRLFELDMPSSAATPSKQTNMESVYIEAALEKAAPESLPSLLTAPSLTLEQYRSVAGSFLRLMNQPSASLDRLNRYELNLWRQASQIMLMLSVNHKRRRQNARSFRIDPS